MWATLDQAVNIYCHLYWAHALIRHYLTGRKYVLIKKYMLNKHVCLLTRLNGIVGGSQCHTLPLYILKDQDNIHITKDVINTSITWSLLCLELYLIAIHVDSMSMNL